MPSAAYFADRRSWIARCYPILVTDAYPYSCAIVGEIEGVETIAFVSVFVQVHNVPVPCGFL